MRKWNCRSWDCRDSKKLELKFEGLYLNPDGTFPNHHPDPSEEKNLEDLKKLVAKKGGIGFAFDGDGDRLALIKGDKVYKGDELAIIFAQKSQILSSLGS